MLADKSPILDQLLEENENLKLQLKDLQRQLAEHSKKEAQHHGRDVDAERRTQEYEKRLAEQAATIEELQRRVKVCKRTVFVRFVTTRTDDALQASAAYEQTIREQEAVIRSLFSSSNPSALSHLYRPFAILMFIFTVCAVIIKVW
jgi:chromosome segregation ATPase